MPRPAPLLVALAWAALLLPWERCRSDCHDRLMPAALEHDCHDRDHGGDGNEPEPKHERFEFVSLASSVKVKVAVPPVAAAAAIEQIPALPLPSRATSVAPPPRRPPPRTVVLIL